jgi:hypothetical protein
MIPLFHFFDFWSSKMISLGFDTMIIDNVHYSDSDLSALFDLLVPLDIKNFVFIHDFNFCVDNLSLTIDKFKSYSRHLSTISPRNTHIKVSANLPLIDNAVENPDLKRLRVSNKYNPIFVSIPIFQDFSDNRFATELNKLLYRKNLFPIFTSYEHQIKSSDSEFIYKLLQVKNCGFAIDINFLFDAKNLEFFKFLLEHNIHILPSISHSLGNYAGVLKSAEHLVSVIGKSEYYQLCSLINHTSRYIGF